MGSVENSSEVWTPSDIKLLRKRLDLTQKEFGDKLGVHSVTVTRWERGSFEPSALAYEKLNRLLKESSS